MLVYNIEYIKIYYNIIGGKVMSALNVSCKETKVEGVECVYENHIGLMYSFDRTDRSVFNVSKGL